MRPNPYSRDTSEPYVKLAPADWFVVTDVGRDGFPDVQIREIIVAVHNGERQYRGYGARILVDGRIGEHPAKFIWISPDELTDKIKAVLG